MMSLNSYLGKRIATLGGTGSDRIEFYLKTDQDAESLHPEHSSTLFMVTNGIENLVGRYHSEKEHESILAALNAIQERKRDVEKKYEKNLAIKLEPELKRVLHKAMRENPDMCRVMPEDMYLSLDPESLAYSGIACEVMKMPPEEVDAKLEEISKAGMERARSRIKSDETNLAHKDQITKSEDKIKAYREDIAVLDMFLGEKDRIGGNTRGGYGKISRHPDYERLMLAVRHSGSLDFSHRRPWDGIECVRNKLEKNLKNAEAANDKH